MTVYIKKPKNFTSEIEVAGCFIIDPDSRFLIMKRSPYKPYGNTWGIPAGKVEPGESPFDGNLREVKEETGICLSRKEVQQLGTVYTSKANTNYVFHCFRIVLHARPVVDLHLDEHTDFIWTNVIEAKSLSLIPGAIEIFSHFSTLI